ncbi:MAG TPA: Rap1a/Tai family immunity protein [Candidatus Eisenbacteria bacterium]|nr:Rap1a/Tai family immunity protein [Candidatus Eisenbacteria bacterium]
MKHRGLMVFSVLTLFVPLNMAVPQKSEDEVIVYQGFMKTEKYLGFGEAERAIYAAGLMDGILLAPLFDAPSKSKYFRTMQTCVNGMTNTQVAAIITKYAKDHPEEWHLGANVVAWKALRGVCPVQP